ncbi:hypothetical protein, partial [Streptomyces boluensis]
MAAVIDPVAVTTSVALISPDSVITPDSVISSVDGISSVDENRPMAVLNSLAMMPSSPSTRRPAWALRCRRGRRLGSAPRAALSSDGGGLGGDQVGDQGAGD